MKHSLIMFLLLLVSCHDLQRQNPAILPPIKHETNTYQESIHEMDLLDIFLEVPIQLTNQKIIFNESRHSKDVGMHAVCESSFEQGDSYSYLLKNDYLILTNSNGDETVFTRVNPVGSDIFGAWKAEYFKDKMIISKRLVILNENEMVERTHCEG